MYALFIVPFEKCNLLKPVKDLLQKFHRPENPAFSKVWWLRKNLDPNLNFAHSKTACSILLRKSWLGTHTATMKHCTNYLNKQWQINQRKQAFFSFYVCYKKQFYFFWQNVTEDLSLVKHGLLGMGWAVSKGAPWLLNSFFFCNSKAKAWNHIVLFSIYK